MTEFWHGIGSLFEDFLFVPFNILREWQDATWWGANIVNFIFILIAAAAFIYWSKKQMSFQSEDDHDYDKD